MKYIDNGQTQICDTLCKCKKLNTLSLMYRNRHNTSDLYTHYQCFNLLYELSVSLMNLKVLSLEYGPLIDYEWQEKYQEFKQYIENNENSLVPNNDPILEAWATRQRVLHKKSKFW